MKRISCIICASIILGVVYLCGGLRELHTATITLIWFILVNILYNELKSELSKKENRKDDKNQIRQLPTWQQVNSINGTN